MYPKLRIHDALFGGAAHGAAAENMGSCGQVEGNLCDGILRYASRFARIAQHSFLSFGYKSRYSLWSVIDHLEPTAQQAAAQLHAHGIVEGLHNQEKYARGGELPVEDNPQKIDGVAQAVPQHFECAYRGRSRSGRHGAQPCHEATAVGKFDDFHICLLIRRKYARDGNAVIELLPGCQHPTEHLRVGHEVFSQPVRQLRQRGKLLLLPEQQVHSTQHTRADNQSPASIAYLLPPPAGCTASTADGVQPVAKIYAFGLRFCRDAGTKMVLCQP